MRKVTGVFCCRNNGKQKNPISGGSKRWAERNGLTSHQYHPNDPQYKPARK